MSGATSPAIAGPVPVLLVTGFLGSGKTTLLAHLLQDPEMGETAVLVNEIGDVALDHHLLRRIDERTVLLSSGCVCCTMRGDLADELRALLGRRSRGEVPWFTRLVVETTGLAEPAPIVTTLLAEPVLRHHVRLEAIVATVDAVHAPGQLDRRPASVRQIAAADVIVLTKADLAVPARRAHATRLVRAIHPTVAVLESANGRIGLRALLAAAGRPPASRGQPDPSGPHPAHDHLDGVEAFSLVFEEPLDWTVFGIWLTMLLARHGADVLRVKGLLDTGGPGPVVLNGVQHAVHPPEHLDAWPDGDRRSRLTFVTAGLGRETIEASLRAFIALVPSAA